MFTAFLRALGQLTDPPILRVLGASVLLSLLCFVAAWSGVAWLLASLEVTHLAWLDTALAWLGGFATLVLTWFLFPLLASASSACSSTRSPWPWNGAITPIGAKRRVSGSGPHCGAACAS